MRLRRESAALLHLDMSLRDCARNYNNTLQKINMRPYDGASDERR